MAQSTIQPYFDPETGLFLLRLDKNEVGLGDRPVQYQGKTLQPKEEVHITIIGSETGQELAFLMLDNPNIEPQIRHAIEQTPWSYRLQDEWYHAVEEKENMTEDGQVEQIHAESILRMAEVPQVDSFYEKLSQIRKMDLQAPPTHVTLYTYGDPIGIGLATQEEFENRVTGPVSPEQLE